MSNILISEKDKNPLPTPYSIRFNLVNMVKSPAPLRKCSKRKSTTVFHKTKLPKLLKTVADHLDILLLSFLSGLHANLPALKIDIVPNTTPARARLKKQITSKTRAFVKLYCYLIKCGLAYPNPSSLWACALLPFHNLSPCKLLFTVDQRPVNPRTLKHQFTTISLKKGF